MENLLETSEKISLEAKLLTLSPKDIIDSKVVYIGASTWAVEVSTGNKKKSNDGNGIFSLGFFFSR